MDNQKKAGMAGARSHRTTKGRRRACKAKDAYKPGLIFHAGRRFLAGVSQQLQHE